MAKGLAAGENRLIQNYAKLKIRELADGRIYHGFWDCLSSFGQNDQQGRPAEPRKGSTMNRVENNVYIFGGMTSQI